MRRAEVRRSLGAACTTLLIASCQSAGSTDPATSVSEFETRLEDLRARSHIAAITAVITQGQTVAWVKSFGIADIATQRSATDTTVYHLASLTKPFASTVLLQLVDEGRIALDDPVSNYGIQIASSGTVRVRHLLSHTSGGVPGTTFAYNGDRFSLLDSVIARGAGMRFAAALQARIIDSIHLRHTAPNPQTSAFPAATRDRATYQNNVARGYTYTGGQYVATAYPALFSSAAGLTASALDVAAFSMAMDRDAFLKPATKALAYAPVVNSAGDTLPYALGWFSTRYKGVRVVWHYGLWTAMSSLIIKVPDRNLTFIVLANTDALSSPYPLGAGKLETSPWAREFLEAFVVGGAALPGAR